MANVDFVSIIMHGSDQSSFVAADIKHSEFSHLIGMRKGLSQLHEIQKSAFPHDCVPMRERWFGVRMFVREFIQALSRNDMH